jgi:hypothetical protein
MTEIALLSDDAIYTQAPMKGLDVLNEEDFKDFMKGFVQGWKGGYNIGYTFGSTEIYHVVLEKQCTNSYFNGIEVGIREGELKGKMDRYDAN